MFSNNKPPISDRILALDLWLLDRFFQPIADRLPEKWSALKIGMSLQLGSLVFSAGSLILLVLYFEMSVFSVLFNVMAWCLGVLFYLSIYRMQSIIRIGFLNPFRMMLAGIRIISIPFAIYSIYLGIVADQRFQETLLLNSISNTIFVFGIYLISCQPNPPPEKKRQTVFSLNTM
ncbi:MAG: hypothetical protein M3Z93_05305 [Commensalibacter sp.]|nr:hypothetical protein [Commensalibacter sp.]